MTDNVLAEPQRDNAGASTFGKYTFQYHWALCKIIEKHSNKQEYALLVEYHEDVVISDSLDPKHAKFDFYQVKNQQKVFTAASLTKRVKSKPDQPAKNSVLGKLLSSCSNKQYEDRVSTIGLVSSNGFSLPTTNNLNLDIIKTGDLKEDTVAELTASIKAELGIQVLPEHLQFIIPEIQLQNQENFILGEFAKLIDTLLPGAQTNVVSIYRAIADDMGRKIRLEFDYNDWERLIEKKSLTSEEVSQTITIHTSHPSVNQIKEDFNEVSKVFSLRHRQIRNLRDKLSLLALKRVGFISSLDNHLLNQFKRSGAKVDETKYESDKDLIYALLEQAKHDGLRSKVLNDDDLMAEVLYQFLTN